MGKTEMGREIAKGLLKIAADLCLLAETLQDGCKTDVAAPANKEPVESVSPEQSGEFWQIKAGMGIPLKSRNSSGASARIS